MAGYDVFPLQDGIVLHDRLKCYECRLVMNDPVQTKGTGLLFCRKCFDETLLKRPESLMPDDQDAWPDNAVRNDINKIPVLCVYHEDGCGWRGLFGNYFKHISTCECITEKFKEEPYCSSTVEENSEAIPVSLSGPALTEQLMIGVGTRQLSKSVEDVIPLVKHYDESQPSPPLDQAHFKIYVQERLDSIQTELTDFKRNMSEDVVADMQESLSRVQTSLANVQFAFDALREGLVETKALAVSNIVQCDGKLTWPIRDVRKRIDAQHGRIVRIFSPPFYTKPDGYKMCLCLYLNGRGVGQGTHLSVYLALMKGECDALLQWPFEHKVNLILIDQDKKDDITRSFDPAGQENNALTRPTNMHELTSYSGFAKFAPISVLSDPRYVKEDTMFIKAIIETY